MFLSKWCCPIIDIALEIARKVRQKSAKCGLKSEHFDVYSFENEMLLFSELGTGGATRLISRIPVRLRDFFFLVEISPLAWRISPYSPRSEAMRCFGRHEMDFRHVLLSTHWRFRHVTKTCRKQPHRTFTCRPNGSRTLRVVRNEWIVRTCKSYFTCAIWRIAQPDENGKRKARRWRSRRKTEESK